MALLTEKPMSLIPIAEFDDILCW